MAVTYSTTSPYVKTDKFAFYLDVADIPLLPYDPSDVQYEIDAIYRWRPDLLAYDLYGDTNLWWIFSARNPNTLQDPIFDFLPGATIYVPKRETIVTALGI